MISQLNGAPHVVERIFSSLNFESFNTLSELCTQLEVPTIWRERWQRYTRVSPTWKMISIQMKYTSPQLFTEMEKGEVSAYQEAYQHVQKQIQRISQLNFRGRIHHSLNIKIENFNLLFKVNERNLYLGCPDGNIRIFNRWTRELVGVSRIQSNRSSCLINLQLDEKVLVAKLSCGMIKVFDLASMQEIQTFNDEIPEYLGYCPDTPVCLENGVLVNPVLSYVNPRGFLFIHKWNPTMHQFDLISETVAVNFRGSILDLDYLYVYLTEKHLVVDFSVGKRMIQVFKIGSWELMRERVSPNLAGIKNECHDGVVVVHYTHKIGKVNKRLLGAWHIDEDVIHPLAELTKKAKDQLTLAVRNHPHQIIINRKTNAMRVYAVESRQRTEEFSLKVQSLWCPLPPNSSLIYYDGLQMYYTKNGLVDSEYPKDLHCVDCFACCAD